MGRILALLGLLLLLTPAGAHARTLDLALIVGNNRHVDDEAWTLRFADDDALETTTHYQNLHPGARVWLLTTLDDDTRARRPGLAAPTAPTLAAWDQTLNEIRRVVWDARAADVTRVRLFFHFSGHGERGGYLHLEDSLLPPNRFRADLGAVGADEVFALLDGCHLAQVIRSGDPSGAAPPLFITQDLDLPTKPDWLGLVGATTAVPEHDWLSGGLLTVVGMSGLLGPADLDGDQLITFFEWSRYIAGQVSGDGFGPALVMEPPNEDWHTTVVDLRQSAARGLRLERDFPAGRVRVVRVGTRELVAELLHTGRRAESVRLPVGDYEVMRLGDQGGGILTADRVEITVKTGLIGLSSGVALERIALVPENVRGVEVLPEGVSAVRISASEARSLYNSPFGRGPGAGSRITPVWGLELRTTAPWWGPAPGLPGGAHPGGALRAARLWSPGSWGRWILSVGAAGEYGVYAAPNLPSGGNLVDGRRHELRLGPVLEHTWSWRKLDLGLHEAALWAPGLVTAGGAVLTDPSAPEGSWRYLYLRNVALEVGGALRVPVGPRWDIGPVVRGELVRFQLSPQATTAPVVDWAATASVGLELRQGVFGG